ncbi:hypothetical protein [Neptunicella sp. SCSIO 80796]|uniref:hypothetical protein n=1 Tax=Neptunicella plasticusilytica TaxID=3117012 RepID=UPI003A4DCDE0
MNSFTIEPGDQIELHGQVFSIITDCCNEKASYLLEGPSGAEEISIDDFHKLRAKGDITILKDPVNTVCTSTIEAYGLNQDYQPFYQQVADMMPGQSAKKVRHAWDYAANNTPMGKLINDGDIEVPCTRTMLRHAKTVQDMLRNEPPPTRAPGSNAFSEELEDFYYINIEDIVCQKGMAPTNVEVYEELETRAKANSIHVPSHRYVDKVIASLDPYDVMVAQKGPIVAARYFRDYLKWEVPTIPLELVEMDAVDVKALMKFNGNEYRKVIIYVALDVCTRSVCGLSFQLCKTTKESETSAASIECLSSIMTHQVENGGTQCHWVARGKPIKIVADAGPAFSNANFKLACDSFGICYATTPTEKGDAKPFIERFFRTLRSRLRKALPGYKHGKKTRGKDAGQFFNDKPLAFEDFKAIVFDVIFNKYHHKPHKGLAGQTPFDSWNSYPTRYIRHLENEADCDLHRGELVTGTIQKLQGLQLHDMHFSNSKLIKLRERMLATSPTKKPKVFFRFNQTDVSKIVVFVPKPFQSNFGKYLLVQSSDRFHHFTHLAEKRNTSKMKYLIGPLRSAEPSDIQAAYQRAKECLITKSTNNTGVKIPGITANKVPQYVEQFRQSYQQHLLQNETTQEVNESNSITRFKGENDE